MSVVFGEPKEPSKRFSSIFTKYYADQANELKRSLLLRANLFLHPLKTITQMEQNGLLAAPERATFRHPDFITNPGVQTSVCPVKISRISRAYFLDIIRYREYHYNPSEDFSGDEDVEMALHHKDKRTYLDKDKRAGYLIKWTLKFQPIQVILKTADAVNETETRSKALQANEVFAYQELLYQLGINKSNIPIELKTQLLHHFKFRPFDEYSFFLTFQQMKQNYNS